MTTLTSEQPVTPTDSQIEESPDPLPGTILAHLGKSHITVYTYPEVHPVDGIVTSRADIDVSICGVIFPLKALNYLIHQFDSDIVTVDYRVRGLIRGIEGRKHSIDHETNSVQNYLSDDTREAYQITGVNVYQGNLLHTKMLLKDFELENYLSGDATRMSSTEQCEQVAERPKHEMLEILHARNMPR